MAFWSLAALRTILAIETDADSPGSEELLGQIRENIEALIMLAFDTGITTTSTSIAETIWTDTGSPFANVEVGMTLLITSGTAIGNMYTIDATNNTTTVTCTGDTMVSDGVVITDTAKVMYDLKVNADGHDHDGVNSKKTAGVGDDAVDQDAIAAAAVGQGELKSTTGSVTDTQASWQLKTLPGGEYGFYPQQKGSGGNNFVGAVNPTVTRTTGTYATIIELYDSAGGGVWAQQRYVQASGEVHWIFILRNTDSGKIVSIWQAPDHPCFGNGGDPIALDQPHLNFDPLTGINTGYDIDGNLVTFNAEIITINPTKAEVKTIKKRAQKDGLDFIEVLLADYDFDESEDLDFPDIEVTVELEDDLDTGEQRIKKAKIPKPAHIKCHKLKKKGS